MPAPPGGVTQGSQNYLSTRFTFFDFGMHSAQFGIFVENGMNKKCVRFPRQAKSAQ